MHRLWLHAVWLRRWQAVLCVHYVNFQIRDVRHGGEPASSLREQRARHALALQWCCAHICAPLRSLLLPFFCTNTDSPHTYLHRSFLLLTSAMRAIEVEMSPGSARKCFSACVEHRAADSEEDADSLSRDQYYYNYANCPMTLPKSFSASAASPIASERTATGDPHATDVTSLSPPLLLEMELDTILREDHGGERSDSPTRSCYDRIRCNTVAQQPTMGTDIRGPCGANPNSSKVHSTIDLIGESATLRFDSLANACHAGPDGTLSLRPPPPLSYITSHSGTRAGKPVSAPVSPMSATESAPPASFTVPRDARVAHPRMSAAPQQRLLCGWRAAMQESIARFLTVEEARASSARIDAHTPCTSSSPVREASTTTVASSASSPSPRIPAGEEKNNEKRCASGLRPKMAVTAELRPRDVLFAPLPVNQTFGAASRRHTSKQIVSAFSAARGGVDVERDQRDGRTAVVAKRDALVKTESVQLSPPLSELGRTAVTSPLSYTDPKRLAALDTAATKRGEVSPDTAEAHLFNEAVVTLTCAACRLSINVFALHLTGTELPHTCYCPFCGNRCAWTACSATL
ncbi:hypothetical protein LtaPh_2809300 [Leishmania tarentolae]|uniref:Uncharacterized protein n=1 Tax=Leishmania tarentolae TaxID=5689 RepID=A0A640KR57_LEITA|nr:hypothetical protein LtaPh_2809300 [Leishmania tarentolae]